jgi:hypothetical protein
MASTTCPNCQTVLSAGTATCPTCGNAQGTGSAFAPPPSSSPPPAAGTSAKPQVKFDLASIGHTDRLVGGGTIVLFIALFLPWFSIHFGGLGTYSADGLTAHGYLYITLFVALGIIGLLAVNVLGVWKLPATSPLTLEQVLLIATALNFVLVLLGFLLKPGGSGVGWSWGAFVALVASVVAAFPLGWPVIQARRNK